MTTADILPFLLQQLGSFSAIAVAAGAIAHPFVRDWLSKRIESGVEEGLKKRLAAFQLDLDKDLEQYRSSLSEEVERAKIDFGIYAAKRHEALAGLFADYLRAEVLITDMSGLAPGESEQHLQQALVAFLERVEAPQIERELATGLFAKSDYRGLGEVLSELGHAARRRCSAKARNDAYEAYFRFALYLPPGVDAAAIAVRDFFHTASIPHWFSQDPGAGREIVENKIRLRFLMLEYQNAARADLSRAAIVREPPVLPVALAAGAALPAKA